MHMHTTYLTKASVEQQVQYVVWNNIVFMILQFARGLIYKNF